MVIQVWLQVNRQKDAKSARWTLLKKSKLPLQKWLVFMDWWSREYLVIDAAEEAKVTETTAIQAYQYFGDMRRWKLVTLIPL